MNKKFRIAAFTTVFVSSAGAFANGGLPESNGRQYGQVTGTQSVQGIQSTQNIPNSVGTGGSQDAETQALNALLESGASGGNSTESKKTKKVLEIPDHKVEKKAGKADAKKETTLGRRSGTPPSLGAAIMKMFTGNSTSTKEAKGEVKIQPAKVEIDEMMDSTASIRGSDFCEFVTLSIENQDESDLRLSVEMLARALKIDRDQVVAFSSLNDNQHLLMSTVDNKFYAIKGKKVLEFAKPSENLEREQQSLSGVVYTYLSGSGVNGRAEVRGIKEKAQLAKSLRAGSQSESKGVQCSNPAWKVQRLSKK